MKTMEAKLEKYNVDQLGEIPIEREDGCVQYGGGKQSNVVNSLSYTIMAACTLISDQ